MNKVVRERTTCRLCDGALLPVFKLAPSPLPNSFPLYPDEGADRFPLELMQCVNCAHVQLRHIVSGLFTEYKYKTPYVPHWSFAAADLRKRFPEANTVLEIGANNASFLKPLRDEGFTAIGVDPNTDDPESLKEYFSESTAKNLGKKFDLIVSNNTFGHIDDLYDVFRGIDMALSNDGALVFEQMYLLDLIEGGTFDRIYSDHLSQFTLRPLARFLKRMGFVMTQFEHLETHGGSMRITARRNGEQAILPEEPLAWDHLRNKMEIARERLIGILQESKPVVAFGASSKACILFNEFGLAPFISFVVDDTSIKQGRYIPGTALQIKPVSALNGEAVLLTAWNYEALIRKRLPNSRLINPFSELGLVQE